MKEKKGRTTVSEVLVVEGNLRQGHNQVAYSFKEFYTDLLCKTSSVVPGPSFWLNLKLPCNIPSEDFSFLANPISVNEVKIAMFSFDNLKSP